MYIYIFFIFLIYFKVTYQKDPVLCVYSRAVSTFWIAHPNNHLISNSAAGSQVWTIFDMIKRIIFTMICNEQWVNVCLQCFHGIIYRLFCDLLWLNLWSLKWCPQLCDIDDENIKAVMQSQIASPHSNPLLKMFLPI